MELRKAAAQVYNLEIMDLTDNLEVFEKLIAPQEYFLYQCPQCQQKMAIPQDDDQSVLNCPNRYCYSEELVDKGTVTTEGSDTP